jgi:di/tricarboxylate transporter
LSETAAALLPLSTASIATLIVLGSAILLFLSGRVRPDLVALLVLASLAVGGVLTPQEELAGFGRAAVVTLVGIFVIAQGLLLTGASARVGDLLARAGGGTEKRLVGSVMVAGAFLSIFMNNVAATSILMPAVSSLAHRKRVYASRLLMPLAFGTLLGGAATLFTTVNLIVSGSLHDHGLEGFGVLDFAPVGIPAAAAGIAWVALWGRRLLPEHSAATRLAAAGEPDLAEVYKLSERLFRARIPAGSFLDGRALSSSTFRERFHVSVVALERGTETHLAPPPQTVMRTGDVLILEGSEEEFRQKDVEPLLELLPPRAYKESDLESEDIEVAEVVLSPRSRLIGLTLQGMQFRSKYGFSVLGIWREGRPILKDMAVLPLAFGDALLVQGPAERLPVLQSERDFIVLSGQYRRPLAPRPEKAWIAALVTLAAFALAASAILPTAESVLLGALGLILTGCVSLDEAYDAIDWKTLFLLVGMLAMGVALVKTGIAGAAGAEIAARLEPYGTLPALAGVFFLAVLVTQILGGPATMAVLAPLAIELATQIGASPRSFAMAVALAGSTAFLTPLGHPVNVLVMGPGGYRFRDYWKLGLPLTIVVSIVVFVLLPIIWPLKP